MPIENVRWNYVEILYTSRVVKILLIAGTLVLLLSFAPGGAKRTHDHRQFRDAKKPMLIKGRAIDELVPLLAENLARRNLQRGADVFSRAHCGSCHRFANEGGAIGPNLTKVADRLTAKEVLEAILEPNKSINDEYAVTVVQTFSGKSIVGRRLPSSDGKVLAIQTNTLNPNAIERISRPEIAESRKLNVSTMPSGLLDSSTEDELLDLLAFLLSDGQPN